MLWSVGLSEFLLPISPRSSSMSFCSNELSLLSSSLSSSSAVKGWEEPAEEFPVGAVDGAGASLFQEVEPVGMDVLAASSTPEPVGAAGAVLEPAPEALGSGTSPLASFSATQTLSWTSSPVEGTAEGALEEADEGMSVGREMSETVPVGSEPDAPGRPEGRLEVLAPPAPEILACKFWTKVFHSSVVLNLAVKSVNCCKG